MVQENQSLAPDWTAQKWFNTVPLRLAGLRGKVVHTFKMLCPGCVLHDLPQAQKIHSMFDYEDVALIGLNTVFEHHAAMTPTALDTFIDTGQAQVTMRAYSMRGTKMTHGSEPIPRR